MSSATQPSRDQSLLDKLTDLYERGRFLEAYRESAVYWGRSTRLEDISIDELILGLRLAARLGGGRVSRWIAREALKRAPDHPNVRYYTLHLQMRGRGYFEYFRSIQAAPELAGADCAPTPACREI